MFKKSIDKIYIIFVFLLSLIITSCNYNYLYYSDEIKVDKVTNLKDDFMMGVDVSTLVSLEESGVNFYSYKHKKQDPIKTLKQSGINYLRVRVWNDPYDINNMPYGGGNCDINKALNIGLRARKYGLKILIDFHYSDFWSDPSRQLVPKAWKDYSLNEKGKAIYSYTLDSLKLLRDNDVPVGMVQIGNEINNAFVGENDPKNIICLMKEARRAIKEVYSDCLIAVHYAVPNNFDSLNYYAEQLKNHNFDYDIFGVSYYSYWNKDMVNLRQNLSKIALIYNKKVVVLETSYPYTLENYDYLDNAVYDNSIIKNISVNDQANYIRDLIDNINKTHNGIGVFYFEGLWLGVKKENKEKTDQHLNKYGIGWTTSYANEYDIYDNKPSGTNHDNETLFDSNGNPLESLKVFNLIK